MSPNVHGKVRPPPVSQGICSLLKAPGLKGPRLQGPLLTVLVAVPGGEVAAAITAKLDVPGTSILVAGDDVSSFSRFLQSGHKKHAEVHGVVVDFGKESDVQRVFQKVDAEFGHLDVFVYMTDVDGALPAHYGVAEKAGVQGSKDAGAERQVVSGGLDEPFVEKRFKIPLMWLEGAAKRICGRETGAIVCVLTKRRPRRRLLEECCGEFFGEEGRIGQETRGGSTEGQDGGKEGRAVYGVKPDFGRDLFEGKRRVLEASGVRFTLLEAELEDVGIEWRGGVGVPVDKGCLEVAGGFASNMAAAVEFCLERPFGGYVPSMLLRLLDEGGGSRKIGEVHAL
ncbi:MAG: hypothetical protein WCO60_01730 [Verrucomicrobiota bacterium]